ncbi:hypothetical protein ABQ013_15000 [Xanthomonas citri pv. malvacearum]|uniref:Uncharacterized protein n=2 Tax=Xanthomonas TaxID=338 RepID=A0AA45BW09_XANCM|nr:hypothetical protein BGK55_12965 [Xanthomonas citri pv. malvacearum]EKQ63884.1 hypothetical protein MOU_13573 [Xanthomonas citri pv. malvacearum str. GSPB1386]NMI14656.1 hypothetical protein [Xanthomonas citri]OOW87797.1 hypothetical protein Xvtf_14415 [Xanthomonas campestris pv. vitistrifoliae]ASN01811.1 hypothetical protein APY29_13635 [Xanthomonas citri pv. malvacearum]
MQMESPDTTTLRELQLTAQFGGLLSTSDIAQLLRYRTPQAVRKARIRGALTIPMQQLPNRRGLYATARAVAVYLEELASNTTSVPQEAPIDVPVNQ